jgi:hypothetical protein
MVAYAARYHAGPPNSDPDFGEGRYAAVELPEKDHSARHVVKSDSQNEGLWNRRRVCCPRLMNGQVASGFAAAENALGQALILTSVLSGRSEMGPKSRSPREEN